MRFDAFSRKGDANVTSEEHNVYTLCQYVLRLLVVETRSAEQQAALVTDLRTLRRNVTTLLGDAEDRELAAIERVSDQIVDLEGGLGTALQHIRDEQGLDTGILKVLASSVATLLRGLFVPPSAVWTFDHFGFSVSGRSPMPLSIIDTDQGWGVKLSSLKDALGEAVDPAGYGIVLTVDDPALVALTDNGDGSGVLGSALSADNAVDLPASTTLRATITQPDGGTFSVEDVITVVAGEAVTGDFGFTAPASSETTPAPVEGDTQTSPIDEAPGQSSSDTDPGTATPPLEGDGGGGGAEPG